MTSKVHAEYDNSVTITAQSSFPISDEKVASISKAQSSKNNLFRMVIKYILHSWQHTSCRHAGTTAYLADHLIVYLYSYLFVDNSSLFASSLECDIKQKVGRAAPYRPTHSD